MKMHYANEGPQKHRSTKLFVCVHICACEGGVDVCPTPTLHLAWGRHFAGLAFLHAACVVCAYSMGVFL